MFEKESEYHCNEVLCSICENRTCTENVKCREWRDRLAGFYCGAEFGYNKGKEDAKEELEQIRNERNLFQEKCDDIELNYYCDKLDCQFLSRNNWHYPSKGELPKDNDEKLCFYGKGKVVARYNSEYSCWETYFNNLETVIPSSVIIAWKEIVLPELPKEIEK